MELVNSFRFNPEIKEDRRQASSNASAKCDELENWTGFKHTYKYNKEMHSYDVYKTTEIATTYWSDGKTPLHINTRGNPDLNIDIQDVLINLNNLEIGQRIVTYKDGHGTSVRYDNLVAAIMKLFGKTKFIITHHGNRVIIQRRH